VDCFGNEHITNPGCVHFGMGNISGAAWRVYRASATLALQINGSDGACTGGVINAAYGIPGLDSGAKIATAQLPNSAIWSIATKTAVGPYAMSATDYFILCDASSNNVGITLPAQAAGRVVHIKRTDSSVNTVTLTPLSGTVKGAASITLTTAFAAGYEAILVSNGTNWY
jgi:hypothetical protein